MLFDLLCLSAVLGYQLPQDDINHSDLTGRLDPRPRLRRGLRRTLADGPTLGQREWHAAGTRLAGRLTRALRSRDLTAQDADGNFEAPAVAPVVRAEHSRGGLCRPAASDCASGVDHGHQRCLAPCTRRRSRVCHFHGSMPRGWRRSRARLAERAVRIAMQLARDPGSLGVSIWLSIRGWQPLSDARSVNRSSRRSSHGTCSTGGQGDYFWPHTDSVLVHANVFICLEHHMPAGASRPSAFVAFRANGRTERFELSPGDAIAAHTQGCVHAREPLQEGERVTLLAIALKPRAVRRARRRSVPGPRA